MRRGGVKSMKKAGKKAVGRGTRKKKSPRKAARKKSRTKAKASIRRKTGKTKKKKAAVSRQRSRGESYVVDTLVGLEKERRAPPGLQSGDLQGLSSNEVVDSQSVDELLEEGNAFEAGVVAAVEDSENAGTREVRTREVPVDDVPEEYLDQD
jgi:hypothetical protein